MAVVDRVNRKIQLSAREYEILQLFEAELRKEFLSDIKPQIIRQNFDATHSWFPKKSEFQTVKKADRFKEITEPCE